MKMFENIYNKLLAHFSEWIQVNDPKSYWTLDNAPIIKDVGVDAEVVKPHCAKCVVVNQCWFKNEKSKKPERFDYTTPSTEVLEKLKGDDGLYHPHCHCEEKAIANPTEKTLKIVVENTKVDDFFRRKNGLAISWGYTEKDKSIFKDSFISSTQLKYLIGDYSIFKYDEFGFQITIIASIPGINEKQGKTYKFQTGFMIYPNGKIQNTTIYGGKIK